MFTYRRITDGTRTPKQHICPHIPKVFIDLIDSYGTENRSELLRDMVEDYVNRMELLFSVSDKKTNEISNGLKTTNFYLEESVINRIKQLNRKQGIPKSFTEFIRNAINYGLLKFIIKKEGENKQ